MTKWQDISTAPKDGTKIVLGHPDWDVFPKAYWGEIHSEWANNDTELLVYEGWLFEDDNLCLGCDEGVLGWICDIEDGAMPTGWMPLPDGPEEK